jgi:hypothetical protein
VRGDGDRVRGRERDGGGRQPAVHTPLLTPGRTVIGSGASKPLTAAISGAPRRPRPALRQPRFRWCTGVCAALDSPSAGPLSSLSQPALLFPLLCPLAPPRHGHCGGDLLLSLLASGWVVGDGTGRRARRRRHMVAARRRATACGCAATADGEEIFSRGF